MVEGLLYDIYWTFLSKKKRYTVNDIYCVYVHQQCKYIFDYNFSFLMMMMTTA